MHGYAQRPSVFGQLTLQLVACNPYKPVCNLGLLLK